MSNGNDKIEKWGEIVFFLFWIATTISLITTTHLSRSIIEPARLIAALGFVLGCVYLILSGGYKIGNIRIPIIIFVLLYGYGYMQSLYNGGISIVEGSFSTDLVLIFCTVLLLSVKNAPLIGRPLMLLIVWYAFACLLFTVGAGGVEFTFPPALNYEYTSFQHEKVIRYSQGVSKFYAVSAIVSLWGFLKFSASKREKWFLGIMGMVFFGVAIIGGARGEALILLFIVSIYFASSRSVHALAATILVYATGYFIFESGGFDSFVFVERFKSLDGSLGVRDVLLEQSIALLSAETSCLIVGCGFGYFEYYNNYPKGLSPHNVLLESVMVWGLPVVLSLFVFFAIGLKRYIRFASKYNDAFVWVFFFYILVSLKSGTIFGSWTAVGGFVVMSSLGINTFFTKEQRR